MKFKISREMKENFIGAIGIIFIVYGILVMWTSWHKFFGLLIVLMGMLVHIIQNWLFEEDE